MAISALASRAWEREENSHRVNWWSSAMCRAYYNAAVCGELVSGTSEGCRVVLRRALNGRELDRAISVGCGTGIKELAILEDGLVRSFDLWEISNTVADEGRRNAAASGLENRVAYHVGDAFAETQAGGYDLVTWDHSLHHMSDVDAAVAWSVKALRPGGFVMINDYIGPNRLQFLRTETDRANAFLARAGVARRIPRSTVVSKLRQWWRDPSEAPQSESIAEAVARHMPGADLASIGGAMLNMLGPVIVPFAKDEDDPVLRAFLDEDAKFKAEGYSHFAFALWRKPEPA
jgi:SAM-dependent methyltransferase